MRISLIFSTNLLKRMIEITKKMSKIRIKIYFAVMYNLFFR